MFIILLILVIFQSPSYKIKFQFSNAEEQPASANIKLYCNGQIIREYQTDGAFEVSLPKGDYKMQIIRCDTSYVNFKADRKKMVWVVVNDNCVQ